MSPALKRRAEEVLRHAKARRLTLATVESCTAGALGLLLADAPGATEVFHGGADVDYAPEKPNGDLRFTDWIPRG